LLAAGRGDLFGDLFLNATAGFDPASPLRQEVSERLREVIIKSWTLVGMPRAIAASYSLQAVDPTDRPVDPRRLELVLDPEKVMQRGKAWFELAFQDLESKIFSRFNHHKELGELLNPSSTTQAKRVCFRMGSKVCGLRVVYG